MRVLALWLLPLAGFAGPSRFARLGEMEGAVEVQLHASDPWQSAARNLPLVESSRVRTAASSRLEIELDDGSALRLAGESQAGLSDYTRFSTGQRVTLVTLERGLGYFTGEPQRRDALILAVPGAQVALRRGARVRLEARPEWSQIAMLEGAAKFSSPGVELELAEGQMARVEVPRSARFFLYREITGLDTDGWSEERDKQLLSSNSAKHVPALRYGMQDLDTNGSWIDTKTYGLVWKPKVPEAWAPFRDGSWKWYDEVGYAWIANEPWGWLPAHYGRWIEEQGSGWVWAPGSSAVFKPGDVYWLRDRNWLGWGPLTPSETWDARSVPRAYLKANTTFARWAPDTRELIPGDGPDKPRDPLAAAVFVIAPPSPALAAARLEAAWPEGVVAGASVVLLPEVTYPAPSQMVAEVALPAQPPDAVVSSNSVPPRTEAYAPAPMLLPIPVPDPIEVYYPVPVYTGIVVVNPPERPERRPPPARMPPPVPVMPPVQPNPPTAVTRNPIPVTPPYVTPPPPGVAPPPARTPPQPPPIGKDPGDRAHPPITRPGEPERKSQ